MARLSPGVGLLPGWTDGWIGGGEKAVLLIQHAPQTRSVALDVRSWPLPGRAQHLVIATDAGTAVSRELPSDSVSHLEIPLGPGDIRHTTGRFGDVIVLEVRADAWVPSLANPASSDTRRLGIQLTRIRLQREDLAAAGFVPCALRYRWRWLRFSERKMLWHVTRGPRSPNAWPVGRRGITISTSTGSRPTRPDPIILFRGGVFSSPMSPGPSPGRPSWISVAMQATSPSSSARGAPPFWGSTGTPRRSSRPSSRPRYSILDIEYRLQNVYEFVLQCDHAFDYVLFLGTFYHTRYPLLILDRLPDMTKEKLYFQTIVDRSETGRDVFVPPDIVDFEVFKEPGFPAMYFIENKLHGAFNNWFVCNSAAVFAVLRSAGFSSIQRSGADCFICEPATDLNTKWRVAQDLAAIRLGHPPQDSLPKGR